MLAIWFSGSSAFSKCSLYIWKFSVHVLLKPSLKDFEHNLAGMWDECNFMVIWTFFGIAFRIGMKTNLIQSCGHCWVFQICWHIECSTLTASSFRIWNRLAGIPSPPLALFIVMLPRPTWLCTPGCLALGEWPYHHAAISVEIQSVQGKPKKRTRGINTLPSSLPTLPPPAGLLVYPDSTRIPLIIHTSQPSMAEQAEWRRERIDVENQADS